MPPKPSAAWRPQAFRISNISLIANNEDDRYSSHASRTFDGTNHHDDDVSDGAGTGATVGTLAGGGAGLLAGLGMLAIPGLGPVVAAGWLVSDPRGRRGRCGHRRT